MLTKLVMELINPPEACSNMAACFLEKRKQILSYECITEYKMNHIKCQSFTSQVIMEIQLKKQLNSTKHLGNNKPKQSQLEIVNKPASNTKSGCN